MTREPQPGRFQPISTTAPKTIFTYVFRAPATYFESNLTQIWNLSRLRVDNAEGTTILHVLTPYLYDDLQKSFSLVFFLASQPTTSNGTSLKFKI